MARRNKLALYYFLGAIGLFILGYGLAWFSEQPFFTKEVFPKHSPTPSATPTPTPDTDFQSVRQTPTPKPSTKPGQQYTVQPGDTISSIASANGVDWESLAEYNNIAYPYNLTTGQVLSIPGQ